MRILGVMGSPREKGNTDVLLAEVLAGAEERGAMGQVVRLGELDIRECLGCHACWRGRSCNRQDDMKPLHPRIEAASGIVLATPVYWYGPTALMKLFIDRLVYFNCPTNRA